MEVVANWGTQTLEILTGTRMFNTNKRQFHGTFAPPWPDENYTLSNIKPTGAGA